MELHWKGLCLQEFTILVDFSVKSFMALIINTEKFHRFQKEGVQKSRNAVENDKNISQGIRIENSEVTAP